MESNLGEFQHDEDLPTKVVEDRVTIQVVVTVLSTFTGCWD